MIRLILFFKKISIALLFLGLEIFCFSFFLENNRYNRARSVAAADVVVGALHGKVLDMMDYFRLDEENRALMAENARLRSALLAYQLTDTVSGAVGGILHDSLLIRLVRVVRNTITQRDNFITLSAGRNQGIQPDMALFNSDGIVGYVLHCSDNVSVATSVLNHSLFRTSGKIAGTDFTGSISWNGRDYRTVDFDEVPKYSDIKRGDTIMTTSYSNIFPADLPIGVVDTFELVNATFYRAKVTLFADLSRIGNLYAVGLPGHDERAALEAQVLNRPETQ